MHQPDTNPLKEVISLVTYTMKCYRKALTKSKEVRIHAPPQNF